MPKYRIHGADGDTGENKEIVISAETIQDAESIASGRNLMVAKMVEIESDPPVIVEQPQPVPIKRHHQEVNPPQKFKSGKPECPLCGGLMKKKTVSQGNFLGIIWALILFCFGALVALFLWWTVIGLIVGLLMCLYALFSGGKRKKVLKCKGCGYAVDRTQGWL